MLEDRLEALFKKEEEYTTLEKMKGSTLVGKKYRPLFTYFEHLKSDQLNEGAFRIVRLVNMELYSSKHLLGLRLSSENNIMFSLPVKFLIL